MKHLRDDDFLEYDPETKHNQENMLIAETSIEHWLERKAAEKEAKYKANFVHPKPTQKAYTLFLAYKAIEKMAHPDIVTRIRFLTAGERQKNDDRNDAALIVLAQYEEDMQRTHNIQLRYWFKRFREQGDKFRKFWMDPFEYSVEIEIFVVGNLSNDDGPMFTYKRVYLPTEDAVWLKLPVKQKEEICKYIMLAAEKKMNEWWSEGEPLHVLTSVLFTSGVKAIVNANK